MCSRFIALNFLLLLALPEFTRGQATSPTPTSDAANLTGLTTPIDVEFSDHRILSGSGFFYMEFGPDDPTTKGPHWRTITHLYVVTAKHLIQPKRLRDLVKLTYAMRSANGEKVEWLRFDLNGEELGKRLHVCKREEIDVAVIDVTGDLATQMKQPLAHGQDVFVAPARCTFKDLQTSRGKSQDDVSQ